MNTLFLTIPSATAIASSALRRTSAGQAEATAERRSRELESQLEEAVSERDALREAQVSGFAEASEHASELEVGGAFTD